jgi:general secretion pathway protein L
MGDAGTPELAEALQAAGFGVEMLNLELGGQLIDGPFLPAVALALRARSAKQVRSFNFRRGQYALRGEWANLKRKLVLLASMLGMTALILFGSMALKYADKSNRAEQLQAAMVNVYRSLFPSATTIVDVPMQLRSAIRELEEKGNLIAGGQATTLAVLKEISLLPGIATVEIQEFALTPEELKLTGRTASFEAVNKMAKLLGDSPMFAKVQVSDAKMSLDGSRIDFRLLLTLAKLGVEK